VTCDSWWPIGTEWLTDGGVDVTIATMHGDTIHVHVADTAIRAESIDHALRAAAVRAMRQIDRTR
jgi:hypothetical protein